MKNAIILAAGVGNRLRPLTDKLPKCCVPIANKSLIRRIIEQLLQKSPQMKISIAGGYLIDSLRSEVVEYKESVSIVENVNYATTNNMESCRLVLDTLSFTKPILIINGDCIYSDSIVHQMIDVKGDCIGVDSSEYFEENMKVRIRNQRIVDIAKTLPDQSDTITSIDFYSFEISAAKSLYGIMMEYHAKNDLNQWTEVAIRSLLLHTPHIVKPLDIRGNNWVEIDNQDDLDRAERLWTNVY